MESSPLAQTIVQHRKRQGLSQEELAERAKVSLRTIQRLETGQNAPRGYTLQALAEALAIPLSELTNNEPTIIETSSNPIYNEISNDKIDSYVALMYLSALSFLAIPGANLVLPLIMRYYKREIPSVYEAGSRLLNFELVWSVVTYGGYLLLLFVQTSLLLNEIAFLIWTPFMYLWSLAGLHVVLLLIAAWRARKGRYETLPPLVRFF
jgi:XRE family transcriptional regulator, regulator of sulfur utilization